MNWDHDYANYVDEKGTEKIQELENKIGKLILAYPTLPVPGELSEEDKEKIESLEKKLCVRLVAYEKY